MSLENEKELLGHGRDWSPEPNTEIPHDVGHRDPRVAKPGQTPDEE